MSTPLVLTGRSPRAELPFLFTAQAQKEGTVNEALARIDALLTPCVEGQSASPPSSPAAGECWIVAPAAQGDWAGQEQSLASYIGGTWLFSAPHSGMRVFDRSTGCALFWVDGWRMAALPSEPTGGATIDAEARAALSELIVQLRNIALGA